MTVAMEKRVSNGGMEAGLVIIGGGPAGLAAAVAAQKAGCRDILILERDVRLGGILNQCIHNGFGLHTFREELTGPEYADRFIRQVQEAGIPYLCSTMVLDIDTSCAVTAVSRENGLFTVQAEAVLLAMGCRERPRGALNIPGYRPAGIFSAGTAQHYVNIEGLMPGKEAVILGSGDIGLIMARRLTLEGARVKAVAEIMPYSGGLKRNIVQCLDDFQIPLLLNTTVVDIRGRDRVEGVTLARVDENKRPVPGTEQKIDCDTLLLSCGLIPENELTGRLGVEMSPVTGGPVVDESYATGQPGVFACGNVLHVHDLVDYVTEEAGLAGEAAAAYIAGRKQAPAGQDGGCAAGRRGGQAVTEQEERGAKAGQSCPEQEERGAKAGQSCPEPVKKEPGEEAPVPVVCGSGIRYAVPFRLHPGRCGKLTYFKFRVADEYRDVYVSLYLDGERVQHQKKRILAPGEMQRIAVTGEQLRSHAGLQKIRLVLEEE